MKRLSGKEVSEFYLEKISENSQLFVSKGNTPPGLAVILVGENPASLTYVSKKAEVAEKLGFMHFQFNLCEDCEESELLELIDRLNNDDGIDGILVQLPLPSHLSEKRVIERICPDKDVDGFTDINMGRLCIGADCFVPCTPLGILRLLQYYDIKTEGKNTVVIGRSNIVGKPMAMLLMQKGIDATVTVCNTKTVNLKKYTSDADIVIIATGSPGTIDSSFIKDKTVVIDVGVNRIPDATREKGFRLVGDADYKSFKERDVSITPVPGGVGLMTVSMLMENTLKAAERRRGK